MAISKTTLLLMSWTTFCFVKSEAQGPPFLGLGGGLGGHGGFAFGHYAPGFPSQHPLLGGGLVGGGAGAFPFGGLGQNSRLQGQGQGPGQLPSNVMFGLGAQSSQTQGGFSQGQPQGSFSQGQQQGGFSQGVQGVSDYPFSTQTLGGSGSIPSIQQSLNPTGSLPSGGQNFEFTFPQFTVQDYNRLTPRQQGMIPQIVSILGSLVQSISSTMSASGSEGTFVRGGTTSPDMLQFTMHTIQYLLNSLSTSIPGVAQGSDRGGTVFLEDAVLVPVSGLNARCLGNGEYCGCPIGMFMRQSDGVCMLHLYVGGGIARAAYSKADADVGAGEMEVGIAQDSTSNFTAPSVK